MKLIRIVSTGCIIICFLIYLLITYPTPSIDHVRYYGMFNYKLYSNGSFSNSYCAIEPYIFAYCFETPYMYTYGVSGYAKTDVTINGGIEKIPNIAYDISQDDSTTGIFSTSVKKLRYFYGEKCILKKTLNDMPKKDRLVFEQLKKEGEENKKNFFLENVKNSQENCYEEGLSVLSRDVVTNY